MSRQRHHFRSQPKRRAAVSISDRRFCRIPKRGRIAGVCAGIADYFDYSSTMVRFAAVTGLIFVPQITLLAYIIAWLVVPTRDEIEAGNNPPHDDDEADPIEAIKRRQSHFDDALSNDDRMTERRRAVRRARQRLVDIERRIQSIEAYVTSSRYQLGDEIRKL